MSIGLLLASSWGSLVSAGDLPGVVRLPLKHISGETPDNGGETFVEYGPRMGAELLIGSNNQTVEVIIDTDFAEMWTVLGDTGLCSYFSDNVTNINYISNLTSSGDGRVPCNPKWVYDPLASSTGNVTDELFACPLILFPSLYAYGGGLYAHDDIVIGNTRISQAIFGGLDREVLYHTSTEPVTSLQLVAESYTNYSGPILGLGFYNGNGNGSISVQMKNQGIINHNVYSIWLDMSSSNNSELIFGGIDHSKYVGDLQTIPVLFNANESSIPEHFTVALHGISVYTNVTSVSLVSCAMSALIGLGHQYIYMPSEFLDAIVNSVDGVYNKGIYAFNESPFGAYWLPCNLTGGITFDFSGVEINVPFSEIITPHDNPSGICRTRLARLDGEVILGAPFLRSAYTVFDLDNYEVSIAKSSSNSSSNPSDSSLEVISSTVPGAKKAPRYNQTTTASSFNVRTVAIFSSATASEFLTSKSKNTAPRIPSSVFLGLLGLFI